MGCLCFVGKLMLLGRMTVYKPVLFAIASEAFFMESRL